MDNPIRVATINFRGFVRGNAGGVAMGFRQAAGLFEKFLLDVLIITEHKMGGDSYAMRETHKLSRKVGLDCVISGGSSPAESHGTGVMILWKTSKDGGRVEARNCTHQAEGRVASAEFINSVMGRKHAVLIVGVYGVSGGANSGAGSKVWECVGKEYD